jgi:hypothetical protein
MVARTHAQLPRLRLLRRRAPRNDVRAVRRRDSGPSGGRERKDAEQSQFASAGIRAKSFVVKGL